jgi:tetratricopeptide (TPR) repeat protein
MRHLLTIFILLLALSCCTTEADRNRMRTGLDSINQRNRNDQPFTMADVEPYVQFFDDHGTSNDRLLAHYLLGRAYYDHGEVPMALECYQKAAECADTLSEDCDYAQLARVYAQLADLFYYQGLYRQQLELHKRAINYALTAKDTLAGLMCYEQMSLAYMELKDTTSAMVIIEDVYRKYRELGRNQNSAISLGLAIKPLINKRNFKKAKEYIDIYESQSGRFDSVGNIEAGREIYYGVKGFYFLQTNILDSAKYYFLKELKNCKSNYNLYVAAKGLSLYYQEKHQADSSANYALYACAMLDSVFTQKTTKEVERIQAMYNYTRHQEIAHQEQKKANQRTIIIWICIGIIIVVSLLTLIFIRELTRKRKVAEQKYMQSQSAIEQAQSDIAKLRNNAEINKELISEKEQVIREQETIMKALLQRNSNSQSLAGKRLNSTEIYRKFAQLSVVGQKPTNAEWEQMGEQIFKTYPGFKDLISKNKYQLNDKEYKTCMLIRIGFKPKMVSHMLEVDPSYISNIRSEMLQKLFNLSGNSKSFDKMLMEIY